MWTGFRVYKIVFTFTVNIVSIHGQSVITV